MHFGEIFLANVGDEDSALLGGTRQSLQLVNL